LAVKEFLNEGAVPAGMEFPPFSSVEALASRLTESAQVDATADQRSTRRERRGKRTLVALRDRLSSNPDFKKWNIK